MADEDRVLVEALLRAVRSFRHASHAAELAILKWMEVRGLLPEKERDPGDRKVR
jgi:hypothetical protein